MLSSIHKITGSLRAKIIILLFGVVVAYVAADFALQRATITRQFQYLEEEEAVKNVSRITEALQREAADVQKLCKDFSEWEDLAMLALRPDPGFIQKNLSAKSLANKGIDVLYICDRDGVVVYHSVTDPDSRNAVGLRDFPTERFSEAHPFLVFTRNDSYPDGLYLTEHKPMLISARKLAVGEKEGARSGIVIAGRFLSRTLDEELTKQTRVDFDFWQLSQTASLPPEILQIRDELTASADAIIRTAGNDQLSVYLTINDFRGHPDFLIRANIPRNVSKAGGMAVQYAFVSTLTAGLIILLVLMTLLQKTVLSPLSRLTRHAVEIGKNEDFRAKLRLKRNDEIGVLSREFDQMMEKLESARAALVDAARTAGKSEIATGILHNVGNVLNSVNISSEVVVERVNAMRVGDLEKLSNILAQHASDLRSFVENDPRSRAVPPVLAALSTHFKNQQQSIVDELGTLNEGIISIRELVKSQQSFAVKAIVEEATSLREQCEKAVAITDNATAKDNGMQVTYDFADIPDVFLDRHRLLEILVNVIQNARQAMEAAEIARKRLVIKAARSSPGRLQLSITDNGPGIAPENLEKIFNLGFTTKSGGHGFGLHSSANLATEMGGSLRATNTDTGTGAQFILEIPEKVKSDAGRRSHEPSIHS